MANNGNRTSVLQKYVSDMISVDKHILEAVERQLEGKELQLFPEAQQLVQRTKSTLSTNVREMEQHLERLGGEGAASSVQDAVASVLGAAAGLYDKVRSSTAAKMLRDDYTALSMSAIAHTMLHTTGLALGDKMIADMALRHLKSVTPLITQISRVIPLVVARELAEDEADLVDTTVGPESARLTQQAWDADHVNQKVYA